MRSRGPEEARPPRLTPAGGGPADGHRLLGEALLDQRRFRDAAAEFAAALRLAPELATAWLGLGRAHLGTRDHAAAAQAYEAALRFNGDAAAARLGLAVAHFREGRYAEAERTLRAGLARHPGEALFRLALGTVLLARGQPDRAIRELGAEVALHPSPLAYFQLGEAYRAAGRPEEAISAYRQALALNRRLALAHARIGDIRWLVQGRGVDAALEYEAALMLNPLVTGVHRRLGDIRAADGRWAAALEHYEAERALSPADPEVHRAVAAAAFALGHWAAALAASARAVELDATLGGRVAAGVRFVVVVAPTEPPARAWRLLEDRRRVERRRAGAPAREPERRRGERRRTRFLVQGAMRLALPEGVEPRSA